MRWHDKDNFLLNIKNPIVKHFTGDFSRELEHQIFTDGLKQSQQERWKRVQQTTDFSQKIPTRLSQLDQSTTSMLYYKEKQRMLKELKAHHLEKASHSGSLAKFSVSHNQKEKFISEKNPRISRA
jgi:hypothetical protein